MRNFAAHGRLIQPSSASSLRRLALSHRHVPKPLGARSGALHFALCRGAPGVIAAAWPEPSQTRPTVRSGDPHFHTRAPRARSGDQNFYARARSGVPHFSLCRGTYLPKFGGVPLPPGFLMSLEEILLRWAPSLVPLQKVTFWMTFHGGWGGGG